MARKEDKPKKTTKMPTGERPKQLSEKAKRAMRETSIPSQAAFRAGTQRDRFARQTNAAVFNSKTPTSYSPEPMTISKKLDIRVQQGRKAAMTPKQKAAAAELKKKASYNPSPMSAAAKKKAANRGALRNSLSGLKQTNLDKTAKSKTKTSTKYSPKPMTAEAKKKAASRGKFVSAYSKAKQASDPYLVKREKEIKKAAAKKASYSPAAMTAEAKKYAAFRAKYINYLSTQRKK